jgi:hypothetical protein
VKIAKNNGAKIEHSPKIGLVFSLKREKSRKNAAEVRKSFDKLKNL